MSISLTAYKSEMYHVFLEYLINVRTNISLGNHERIISKGEQVNSCVFQKIIIKVFLTAFTFILK